MLRDRYANITRGAAAESPNNLAGKPARQVSWIGVMQQVDVVVMSHRGTSFALVTADKDASTISAATRDFRLLP